ncbi:unnamed protein product [Toxocara canis]|uniref:Secreted RxLR effector peptide protein n=1 Tax=Toxocara canis TaxID=6265 RepID=A0A183UNC6_TOXCA|nr:unnamed protein product [Toxocara canis]
MSPVLSLLFAVCVLADDDASSKPAYVAPKFVAPTVVGSPLLVDWFDDVKALNKKWILSRGKKDDVEDSIAKYNGTLRSPNARLASKTEYSRKLFRR